MQDDCVVWLPGNELHQFSGQERVTLADGLGTLDVNLERKSKGWERKKKSEREEVQSEISAHKKIKACQNSQMKSVSRNCCDVSKDLGSPCSEDGLHEVELENTKQKEYDFSVPNSWKHMALN